MSSRFSPVRVGPLLVIAAVAISMHFIAPQVESPLKPVVWKNPTDLPALEGALLPNERLLATEHLHEGDLIAPEAFAEGDDGEMYTGLADGRVVRLDPNGENPQTVFFTGGVVSAAGRAVGSTTGVEYGNRLMHECHEKAKAKKLTLEDEIECGRPLGVRWRDRKLYILDAYHGLFELDVKKGGSARHLIDSLTDMPVPLGLPDDAAAAAETRAPLAFLNDLVFTKEGLIFLTDSSWKNPRAHNRAEIVDGGARGRLLRFDPRTGDLRTVMCGLHFPNGVEIDPSEKKLLVVESLRFRILEIDLQRLLPEAPARENPLAAALTFCGEDEALPEGVRIFASALPGFLDGLAFDKTRDGYIAGAGTKVAQPFSPLHLLLQRPAAIRTTLVKVVPTKILENSTPKYGLVFVLSVDGIIKESMHDTTGHTSFISSAHRNSKSGYTFLGSSQNLYLGRIRL